MIKHTRVRVKANKLEEGPLDYSGSFSKANGWTDIRVLDIPPAAVIQTELVIAKGKAASAILADLVKKHGGNWIVVNAPFFNEANGSLLGKTFQMGKIIFSDVAGKTEQRPHFYRKDGRFGIGRQESPEGLDWGVVVVPTITEGGKALSALRTQEKTPADVAAVQSRIVFGTNADGTLGILLVDGRGETDRGLSALESGVAAEHFGYVNSASGDGGGSATLATNNQQLLDALDIKRDYHVADMSEKQVQRNIHHGIAIKFDPAVLFPVKKALFGIDCAKPLTAATAKAVAEKGAKFAVRYLVPETYAWKRLTRKEVVAIEDAGLRLASVFQLTTNRPAGGAANGKVDGKAALAEAKAIAQPTGSAIFMAVDYDVQAKDYDAIETYLRAAQAELQGYQVGVYGHYEVIEEMANRDACQYYWQTYAWSDGKKSQHADMWQYKNSTSLGGVDVDFNEAYAEGLFWNGKEEEEVKVEINVIVNGVKVPSGYVENGVTFTPARAVAEALGAKVKWDKDSNTVFIDKD
jgi:hypothetical protein